MRSASAFNSLARKYGHILRERGKEKEREKERERKIVKFARNKTMSQFI